MTIMTRIEDPTSTWTKVVDRQRMKVISATPVTPSFPNPSAESLSRPRVPAIR
jgi:hypothetical protein